MTFNTLTVAYDDLLTTHVRLMQYRNILDQDHNDGSDKFFLNPLEYGCSRKVLDAIHEAKRDFVRFIIRELSKSEKYQNLIVDEQGIEKYFDIESYRNNEFNAQEVVEYFELLYDINLEQVVYDQILKTARWSIPMVIGDNPPIISRFGANNNGLILHYSAPFNNINENSTVAIIRLMMIEFWNQNPLTVESIIMEPGDTLKTPQVPCKSIKSFKNRNLKIQFELREQADRFLNLLISK